ncbi:MFS transporter [Actinophytocola sp.]|uniref:MFS transporter n=1 Tax=Actinophytocola sp. TaxID=1872138 RepID=UPI003D6B403D
MASLGSRFWKLWTASTLSNLADGLYRVALPLIAVQYTRSPFLVSLVTMLAFLPWLVVSLPAGALTDRLDRRRILVSASVLRGIALGVFAAAMVIDVDSYWMLCVLALLLGVAEVFFEGTAQATLPMMVPDEQLNKANSRLFAARQVSETFVGQAGGGMLFAVAAVAAVFAPAALYGIAVVALVLISGRFVPKRATQTRMREDISEGVRYLVNHRLLRTLALVSGGMNLANIAFHSVFVLYAVGAGSAMGLPEYAFGWLLTATAVGAVIGSLFTERAEKALGRSKVLLLTILAAVAAQAVPAVTANVALVATSFVLHGAMMMVWNVVGVSMRQRIIPEELMGRVSASARIVSWGSMPLGALLGGSLAEVIGLQGMFAVTALISLSLLLGLRVITEPEITAAERATRERAIVD